MAGNIQFTDKAQKALSTAVDVAQNYAHAQLLPVHLAHALLVGAPPETGAPPEAGPTLFRQVVEKANGDFQTLDRAIKKALVRLPSQDPPPDHAKDFLVPSGPGLLCTQLCQDPERGR